MVDWRTHNEVNQSVPELGMYSDCLRHCARWQYYSDNQKSGIPTGAHECTHGIHSDLRNNASKQIMMDDATQSRLKWAYHVIPPAWDHVREQNQSIAPGNPLQVYGSGRVNAVYVGQDRYLILEEPGIRKRDAAAIVPKELRGSRYGLYMAGQTAWDDSPLYVWDEWVAYRNGAQAACDGFDAGKYNERSDQPIGPIEFQTYGICVLIAAEQKRVDIEYLLPFARWHWKACWNTYHEAQKRFEWKTPLFENLRTGASAKPIRDWLKSHGFEDVPDTVVPGWPDDDGSPNAPDFMTI